MKSTIYTISILFLLTILGCTQEPNCVRKSTFGEIEICLPEISGYQECYLDNSVKELADGTEIPANMVLGFYLNNSTYGRKDSLGLFKFDDYFKIYGTIQIKDLKVDTKKLKEYQGVLANNYEIGDWDLMKKEIDKVDLGLEIGKPIVIKNYNVNEYSFTYLMITKYGLEGEEPFTLAMSMSGLLINERMVWMAYYLNYDGDDSVLKVQEQTKTIITNLLK